MKMLTRKGLQVYSTTSSLGDLRDPSHKHFMKRVYTVVRTTCIAFFSFTLHKLFLNIPQLPRQIKIQVFALINMI